MEYFNLLEFNKEPFSNSPEPEFLFASPQHNTCLQRLELAVRLRRGLNVVIGAVGTGKTTLCRKLIQQLSLSVADDAPAIETYLLLDPAVDGRSGFVKTVACVLGIKDIADNEHEWQIKERIKNFLFEKGVQEQKNIVLIIDEGQKIPDDCLEVLREFLNYETNSFKLLQIIIFAQPEFRKSLAARENLLDRVNYIHLLRPLSFFQTKAMIEHRISVASMDPARPPLFTFGGLLAVFTATGGYPRRIVSLCHQALLMMIIRGKSRAGWLLVRGCINKINGFLPKRTGWAVLGLLLTVVVASGVFLYFKDKPDKSSQSLDQRQLSGIDLIRQEDMAQSKNAHLPSQGESALSNKTLPASLGTLTIKKRMTISRILDQIYGENGPEILHQFVAANPQIRNIDTIYEGDIIHLPAIPANARPLKKEMIMVTLEIGRDMPALYQSFMNVNEQDIGVPLLFLSYWNKRQGRQFAVVLNQRFTTIQEAGAAIHRLPPEKAVATRILSKWDGDTVFFNSRLLQ